MDRTNEYHVVIGAVQYSAGGEIYTVWLGRDGERTTNRQGARLFSGRDAAVKAAKAANRRDPVAFPWRALRA